MLELINIVLPFGFPALCLLALGWYVVQRDIQQEKREDKFLAQIDKNNEAMGHVQEKTAEQLSKFAETLNKFNETLIRIDARLESVEQILR